MRQNIEYLLENPVDYFLILSGDQLYNLNFQEMYAFAKETDADVVIATLPVNAEDAERLGILKVNENFFITDFYEKPKDKTLLETLRSHTQVIEQAGVTDPKRSFLGSMGIYLFKRKTLADLLTQDPREDFGKHLIPELVSRGRAAAYLYDGYWEDIGTIETFYQANLALTDPKPKFSFHSEARPIFTCRYDLPPAKFLDTQITRTILCEGSIIEADEIAHSILGPRSVIHKGAIIRDSYLMGNDYYSSPMMDHQSLPPEPHIGENTIITRTIVDKNVTIGNGVQLINRQKLQHYDGDHIFIRDGIIIVPRGATIPDGFIL